MVKVGFKKGQLLNVELFGVGLVIPPSDITFLDTDWITRGVEGLFAPREDIWQKGDANRDGVINEEDTAIVKAAFGAKPGVANWNPDADFNKDGVVDIVDITILSSNFGLDKRGGRVTPMLATTIQTLLSGLVSPVANAVWALFKDTLDELAADYYERHSEET